MSAPLDFLQHIGDQFQVHGRFLRAYPIGKGHINETYAADYDYGGKRLRLVHQTINHKVFPDPIKVMDNISLITNRMAKQLEANGDPEAARKTLTVIPLRTGEHHFLDEKGNYWRTYIFIDRTSSYDTIETPDQAEEVARAYGEFQNNLVDVPGEHLHETIPEFHHAVSRLEAFESAVAADAKNRAQSVKSQIQFVRDRESDCRLLVDYLSSGELPLRVTHNDTKLNNVLFDDSSGKAICVVDLDTVMPGSVLYDFGDMVRTATSPALEDERDLSKVEMQLPMFEALVKGYWDSAGTFLNQIEIDHLPFSGKLLSLVIGMRFLTDHLNGDVYFKVRRPDHNLDRAKVQFKLVESIERQTDLMREAVERISAVPAAAISD